MRICLLILGQESERFWTWLQATKTFDLPINEKAETWFNYFSIENNQVTTNLQV